LFGVARKDAAENEIAEKMLGGGLGLALCFLACRAFEKLPGAAKSFVLNTIQAQLLGRHSSLLLVAGSCLLSALHLQNWTQAVVSGL